jgi:hypothetical protein
MRRIVSMLVGVAAVAMALAGSTQAVEPARVPLPIPDDSVRLDLCAFPVEFHYLDWGVKTTTHEHRDGTLVTIETGVAKVRLTNLDSGESHDLNISGPAKLLVRPDGSFVLTGTGPWLFSDVPPGLGLPSLFLTSGHFEVRADAEGSLVSFERVGRLVDLCAELAE